MGRLRRFPDHRFVGLRETMRVYDCDDPDQLAAIQDGLDDLDTDNRVQTFGPDTIDEARNRGFRPLR